MSSSMLARGLLLTLALSFLAAPVAFADDPGTTTETIITTTTTETTSTDRTETTTETTTTTTADAEALPDPWAETPQTLRLAAQAARLKAVTRRWRALMGKPMPRIAPPTVAFASLLEERRWWVQTWGRKAYWARWHGHRPPHLFAWRCIHTYEGAWRDPNAPYYGGLQMDLTFQRQYGASLLRRKGTANHWTVFEQMWVAERAHRAGRGFYPWPNTARYCGLL
jgi:hypothetical protein